MTDDNEQGTCPVCGSTELDYGVFEYEGDGGYYPVKCEKCHATFKENYSLVYFNQYDIQKHYK